MRLAFTKMHGLGNDFMVIDGIRQSVKLTTQDIQQLSHRHTGIGFDQCLIVEPSNDPTVDFVYRIFNANGEEVGQCGNGARCLARFIAYYGLSTKKSITVATQTTRLTLTLNPDESITVNMGIPQFAPKYIPLRASGQQDTYVLQLSDGSSQHVHALSIGNPHAVLIIEQLETAPVMTLGQQISEHADFPQQTNVGFLKRIAPGHIALRVYERGCGETQACGSGAIAAAAVARRFYQAESHVRVSLLGGDVTVDWPDMDGPIFLTGPATLVYEGFLM